MRQPTDRPLATELAAPPASSVGSLVRRLAIAGLLLVGLTVLASIALAA
jgi:hypothetical protein